MKHFLLLYDYVPDVLEKRAPHRGAHLDLARAAAARGELVLAGALNDAPAGAVFLFQGEDSKAAVTFAEADPYVAYGVVTAWRVREWNTVVGAMAANPV